VHIINVHHLILQGVVKVLKPPDWCKSPVTLTYAYDNGIKTLCTLFRR